MEFYDLIKRRLKKDGILQQWCPESAGRILQAVGRSLVMSFPYVRIFQSIEGWGYHFIASKSPINLPSAETALSRMPERAKADLMEWFSDGRSVSDVVVAILSTEVAQEEFLNPDLRIYISDDHPYNEYYKLRRSLDKLRRKLRRWIR